MTLPPLPPADIPRGCDYGESTYTADQMRAYAEAAALAEREACAKLCDPAPVERVAIGGPVRLFYEQPDNCAAAIRARV